MSGLDTEEKLKKYTELMEKWLTAEHHLEQLFPSVSAPLPKGRDIKPKFVDLAELMKAQAERDRAEAEFLRFFKENC